jgi:hypothetical protein
MKMFQVAGTNSHKVDVETVRYLVRMYIEQVRSDPKAHQQFLDARFTLFLLAIDFAHTIACGDGLKTALEWYL